MAAPRKTTLNKDTAQEVVLDLDALRKAKADGHSPVVADKMFRIDGITYQVSASMPMMFAVLLANRDIEKALRLWLGDDQYETFAGSSITDDEFGALMESLYEVTPGESKPSAS